MRWDAEMYDAVKVSPQMDAGMELISMANVRDTDSILDLGCGTGKLTMELAHLASKGTVIGIDPSQEMLLEAKERVKSIENMSLIQVAAQSMGFTNRFDLVFSNSVMQWIKEQNKVMELLYQSLKDSGRIALQFPAKDFCREFFKYTDSAMTSLGIAEAYRNWKPPWFLPTTEEYETLLKDAGFNNINIFYRDYRLVFKSINEILDWWVSAGLRPFLEPLSERKREYFKYAFAMNFENNMTNRGIEFGFRRLFAFAEK